MEILPETFIGADGYHDRMTAVNRCWMVPFAYGLIPLHDFEIKYAIHNNSLTLEKISCMIMDCEGNVLHLTQGTTVPLPSTAQGTYYLTVSCGDFNHIEKNGVPYLEQKYKYQIINLLNPNSPSLFPLMKLHAGNGEWEVLDFIPPCCTVSTHPLLTDLTHQCGSLLEKILTLVEKNGNEDACYQIGSLLVEMSDSVRSDTPICWMKKTLPSLAVRKSLYGMNTIRISFSKLFRMRLPSSTPQSPFSNEPSLNLLLWLKNRSPNLKRKNSLICCNYVCQDSF